ncbi:MAG TPA: DegT/DnrJ/EryC1/StrS family aminotransferase [Solirubrobacterales bacterium]|jgi:dTDP-4-amino-4,6-dideoxygalactose transaminase|nr:DegT/DnrJ/EryC1/StrS family aminotransferase [Solirubrobacterales bacterium]
MTAPAPAVPLFATRPALEPLLGEVAARQRAVLESGRYVLGPEVESFERELATFVGVRHCVGVGNGTDALTIALRALGIGPGDEVVVPALTFYATAEAVVNAGARPVFCDVDAETFVMTAATAGPAIGERTAALLPVHLFGNPAPMAELRRLADAHGLRLLEDAAQAAGARLDGRPAGSLGDAAAFSFFPSKNLGGFGDGGAVLSDDEAVAAAARRLRAHGSEDRRLHAEVGFNSRLDELQAAGLRVLLPHLGEWTAARRHAARAYATHGLDELCELPRETGGGESCYHLYVVRSEDRERLAAGLAAAGVGSRSYYTTPLHRQPAMQPFAPAGALPATELLAETTLALPMGPALGEGEVEAVVAAARATLAPA